MHARTPLWDRPPGPARVNEPCLVSTSSLPHSVSVATIYSPVASDNHLGVTCSTAQFSPDRTLMRWDEKNIIVELRWSWKKLNRVLRDAYLYVYLYIHSETRSPRPFYTHNYETVWLFNANKTKDFHFSYVNQEMCKEQFCFIQA